jgi:hypothetical protein
MQIFVVMKEKRIELKSASVNGHISVLQYEIDGIYDNRAAAEQRCDVINDQRFQYAYIDTMSLLSEAESETKTVN